LHPGADQRDQLADEEEPEIAVPERAEGCQPSAPAILRRNVPAGLVSFSGFYFRNRIDDYLLLPRPCYTRETAGRNTTAGVGFRGLVLLPQSNGHSNQISELSHFARADLINRVPCRDAVSLQPFTR